MKKILPVLSGSLRTIVEQVKDQYPDDPIAKEILRADKLVEFYLKNAIVLDDTDDIIISEIKNHISDEVTMLSGRFGEELVIAFLPRDKEPEYNENGEWSRKNRQTGKPGRIFQKLLKKEFKQVEWEVFINRFKSCMCCSNNFEIVSGEEITYWYNRENYFTEKGTLGKSCMRNSNCASYFKVYEEHAKMLITTKDGKLTGRALVWEVDGITLLDRIYTCYDYLTNCFIEYAKEHKWWIRENNDLLDNECSQGWLTPEDSYTDVTYKGFTINVGKYEYWPYMDSFRYYNDGVISTIADDGDIYLSTTNGIINQYTWTCDHCGRMFNGIYEDECPDGLEYSEYDYEYLCEDCRWWCDYEETYISNDHNAVLYHDDEDTEWMLPDDHRLLDDAHYIDGEYYNVDAFKVRKNEITGDLELVR